MIFKYELKKIFMKKINIVAMLVGYIILAITTIYPVMIEDVYIFSEDKELTGLDAIKYQQDFAKNQTDELSEEYVTDVLKEIQASNIDPNSDEGYLTMNDKYDNLYDYLLKSYKPIGDMSLNRDTLFKVDIKDGAKFYETRIQRVKELVNKNLPTGNYSKAEKEFWINKAKSVKTPFKWGNTFVVKQYDTVIALSFYMMFVLVVCLSSVFPTEHENRTEGLLLSTKQGQRNLVLAKAGASYTFGFGYLFLGYLVSGLWLYFTIGAEGFDLPIQLLDSSICSSMNMTQYLLLQLLISVVVCFFEISLILFVSAFTRNGMGTMAVLAAGLAIPAFIPFSKESGLFNHLIAFAVVRMMDLEECLVKFIDYKVGPVIMDLTSFAIVIHVVVAVVLVLFLRKIYVQRALNA